MQLFFSYSHRDENLRNELEIHLAMLKREGIISSWHDRRITAGTNIDDSIASELESSQIILLLVSANFLASDYCWNQEMERALQMHEQGIARVIPVILHPCDWQSAPFGKLRATPTDGRPVSMYANQHEAFAIVARDVRAAAEEMGRATTVAPSAPTSKIHPHQAVERSSNLRIKRKFDDHERDEFLENSYEYIARFFEGSLEELAARNPHIKFRFKRTSETAFAASIYDNGERAAQCGIWYGKGGFGDTGIMYSESGETDRNSYNESLTVDDDGYSLHLKPLGMPMRGERANEMLSMQGAAEYLWSLLIWPLQT